VLYEKGEEGEAEGGDSEAVSFGAAF
jgi:hypothetical protein